MSSVIPKRYEVLPVSRVHIYSQFRRIIEKGQEALKLLSYETDAEPDCEVGSLVCSRPMHGSGDIEYYCVLAKGETQCGELKVYALLEATVDVDDGVALYEPMAIFIFPTNEVTTGPQYPLGTHLSVKVGNIAIPMEVKWPRYDRGQWYYTLGDGEGVQVSEKQLAAMVFRVIKEQKVTLET